MAADVKVCKECTRVNPIDAEFCIGCGGEDFDDLYLTPAWNSAEAYLEDEEGTQLSLF